MSTNARPISQGGPDDSIEVSKNRAQKQQLQQSAVE